jgi:predicted secreted protein
MATISANALGVYTVASPQTSPLEVIESATVTGATVPAGYTDGDYAIIVDTNNDWVGLGKVASSAFIDATDTDLAIMSAATSLSVEASNTVNETVAHNGTGGSTTYIVGGAMSWSMSIDGLLDLSPVGQGSSVTIMDAARAKYYVVTKFDTGTNVQYIGQALIDSVSFSGGVDDIATYSASFSGNGDLFKYTES